MIISFEYEPDDLLKCDASTLCHAIEELLRGFKFGHHVVVMKPAVSRWLVGNLTLSAAATAGLNRLADEYTQTADLVRRSSIVLRIFPGAHGTPVRTGKFIDLSVEALRQPYLMEKTVVVFEDISGDHPIYKLIMELAHSKIQGPLVDWEPAHGGGSRTVEVAVEKARERRVVCAVIDSDLNAPREGKLAKVSAIEARADEMSWPLLFAHTPACREIENLIPYDIVRQLPCGAQNKGLRAFEEIDKHEGAHAVPHHDRFWLYVDVKNGCDSSDVEKIKNPDDVQWIRRRVHPAVGTNQTFKIVGFGDNVLRQLVDSNALRAELRKAIRSERWWSVFGGYVTDLIWICACSAKTFT